MGGMTKGETFEAMVNRRRGARMDAVDRMPADLRELVNEYGFNVVNTFRSVGVVKAKQIRHLVETVLDEFSPTRGAHSRQGIRTEVVQGYLRPPVSRETDPEHAP